MEHNQNIQLMELMKLRDRRRERERERERGKLSKQAWSCLWTGVGSLLGFPICRYLIFADYPAIGNFFGYFSLVIGILCIIAYPWTLYSCKKINQELAELSQQIKNLENSIR